MFDTSEKCQRTSKWIIGIFTCCILIYLGFRHISSIVDAISQLLDLAEPILLGAILALIFNVSMGFFERNIRKKTKLQKGARPLAIVLALLLISGIFIGVSLLVIPELVKAVKLIVQITGSGLEELAQIETNSALMKNSIGQHIAKLNIDWLGLKTQLEEWFRSQSGAIVNQVVGAAGSIVSSFVPFFIGFIFAIYIIAGKERLKRQVYRLIHVWLPEKLGNTIFHVASVCSRTFHLFIAGQATEAIILGTLCMIGMIILKLPYAPMVGAIMILTVNPFKAVVFVIFLLILQQVEGNLIYPRVVGSKINLSSIWVLASITIGGNLGGPLGMLLGVPAASAAYALLKEATEMREHKAASG